MFELPEVECYRWQTLHVKPKLAMPMLNTGIMEHLEGQSVLYENFSGYKKSYVLYSIILSVIPSQTIQLLTIFHKYVPASRSDTSKIICILNNGHKNIFSIWPNLALQGNYVNNPEVSFQHRKTLKCNNLWQIVHCENTLYIFDICKTNCINKL